MTNPRDTKLVNGMTLLEMVVAMAIVSLMLGAVSSAVVIAARAVERQSPASFDATSSAIVLDQLLNEASQATLVTENTPTAITFQVPDRNADLAPETIRYSWSGTPGGPLMRQFNADPPAQVSGPLRRIDLSYDTILSVETIPGVNETNANVLISSFNASNIGSFTIDPSTSVSQYVHPSFADGTLSWTITSIDLSPRQWGSVISTGELQVELRAPTSTGVPDLESLAVTATLESDLPTIYTWSTHTFTRAPTLAPGDAICIVLSDTAGTISANLPYAMEGSTRSFATSLNTATGVWTSHTFLSTPYRIRGTVVRQLPDTTLNHTFLVRLSAEIESESGDVARGATAVVNHPELP
jgi:prepilin-type N-terminal cleavage/methylation domain-containing protein